MIQKEKLFFPTVARFLLKKISANKDNTAYRTGALDGAVIAGEPDVMWQSVVYIADTAQIWTNGTMFGAGEGADGLSAYDIALLNGFTGSQTEWLASLKGEDGLPGSPGAPGETGERGEQGEDGLSAYEVATRNGFVGTEQEWLVSLKGEKGAKGDATLMNFEIDPSTGCLMLTQEGTEDRMGFEIDTNGNFNIILTETA